MGGNFSREKIISIIDDIIMRCKENSLKYLLYGRGVESFIPLN